MIATHLLFLFSLERQFWFVLYFFFFFVTQAFCAGAGRGEKKDLGLRWLLVAPNSYLPLPPSGPSANSKNHISSQFSSSLLFLLILLPFMKNDFLELATTSKFSKNETNEVYNCTRKHVSHRRHRPTQREARI